MGKKEKLIKRLLSSPKDFTFEEAMSLLIALEYTKINKGKTSGSRVSFCKVVGNRRIVINLHRPHPRKELLSYQIKDIVQKLQEGGDIE